ncbi:MAG: AMP-binding protein [Myxococcales bacterium]|nr:AMP-binding protein [Myxococcales bacterium]
MGKRISEVFVSRVEKLGARAALKVKRGGRWVSTTWAGYYEASRKAARALMHLGMAPGESVCILGFNSPEWVIANMGAILASGVPAGIYTTNSPAQCQYIAAHSESRVAFAENDAQVAKFLEIRAELPRLLAIVQMTGKPRAGVDGVLSWDAFLALADKTPVADLDARTAAQKDSDVCTLIYTSGTTGDPKAVMITQENAVWTSETLAAQLGFNADDVSLSYLPLSHIAEQMLTIHGPMAIGSTVYFAEGLEALPDNLREVRPTYFLGVPRVWEKMMAKMMAAGAAAPPLRKKLVAWAKKVGLEGGYAEQRGDTKPFLYPLANKLIFSKVRERLGLDRARVCVTSAAPISLSTLEFFLSLGVPLLEVYGMSECTGPATFSTPEAYKTGKCGVKVPGTELKIAEDGEICYRGKHVFKGYLKNEQATREAIDEEGWLHSGDIGTLDKEGYVQITDRKKDLLITAGGENVAPQVIEGALKAIPVVGQAVVLGDRRKFLTALLTLDAERVVTDAQQCGSSARDVESASTDPVFRKHLEGLVEGVNATLARVQTIKKFAILPGELTIEGGELTPTMKVKRKVVNEKYKAEIEALYEGAGD